MLSIFTEEAISVPRDGQQGEIKILDHEVVETNQIHQIQLHYL